MSRRSLLTLCCMSLLAVSAGADGQPRSCCARPDKKAASESSTTAAPADTGKLKCSLTGKVVDKCCCEQRDGATYCKLAKKTVEKCCCSPVSPESKPTT